jgi:hypothetical protein
MLVRDAKGIQADAFFLISFPFHGVHGLGLGENTSSSFESRDILVDVCINHLQNANTRNVSTYTLCRVKPSSWNVADDDGSDLETYQGIELEGLNMPDDCMGDELGLISFEVFPNDTSICIEVSDLLALPSSLPVHRHDLRSTSDTKEDIIMFFIDTFDLKQGVEDRFYTLNSKTPPLMIFYKSPTDHPTSSGENSTSPLPTQLPTLSPSLLNVNESDPVNMRMFGLLSLLLLCPLLFVWLTRRNKLKSSFNVIDEAKELRTRSFDSTPTTKAEKDVPYQDDCDSCIGFSSAIKERGTMPDSWDSFPEKNDCRDSGYEERASRLETSDDHSTDHDGNISSSASLEGNSTFEDEMSGSSGDNSSTNFEDESQ